MALFFLSPSKLAVWRECRRKYRFRYVDRIPQVPRPWLSFGRSIHAVLRALYDAGPARRTLDLAERSLRGSWDPSGYADAEEEQRYRERALATLRRYAAEEPDFATAPRAKALEFSVQQKIDDVVLQGMVDRIDDGPGGLVVIDYKTGTPRAPERARGDVAFTMYAMLVAHRFKDAPASLEWRFVETGDRIVTHREPDAFGRVRADVLAAAADIRAETDYPPASSPACKWCDYLDRCPEGRAALASSDAAAGEPAFLE